ncbi:hypothetical protein [Streptomyces sp. NPDC048669]|uniref:hypothetical protein n=1 Tax=Streptomyces sp. NPDC048669 TaxID=3155267 RepID=UPI00341C76AF
MPVTMVAGDGGARRLGPARRLGIRDAVVKHFEGFDAAEFRDDSAHAMEEYVEGVPPSRELIAWSFEQVGDRRSY